MHFSAPYPAISLDTIANSASYFSGKWNSDLKRNQSQQLLTLLLNKFYWPTKANIFRSNPFHARVQASHAALGETLDLSREWVCKCIKKLREAKWIETSAPRKPHSKYQEVTIFRPGGKLKKLLVMLRQSHQRPTPSTVNDSSQQIPSSSVLKPKQTEKQTDCPIPKGFLEGLGEKMSMLKKIGW